MSLKNFWNKNRQHIIPLADLAKGVVGDVLKMRDKPKALDYVDLALSVRESFNSAYKTKDPFTCFSSPDWTYVSNGGLGKSVYTLILGYLGNRIRSIGANDTSAAFVGEVKGIRFGWILYDNEFDTLYVEKEKSQTYKKVIENLFWSKHSSNHVIMGVHEKPGDHTVYIKEDTDTEFYPSPQVIEHSADIKEYLDHGYCRSILFYGPPGTGKSSLIKGICSKLEFKTLRINNLSQINTGDAADMICLFNPDAIIIEDIDSVVVKDISSLLDRIEGFNKRLKVTFATANKFVKLDNALVRPGRFDLTREIKYLDENVVMDLVDGDRDLYELVRTFPAAYIAEFMKRVKVKGKEWALANKQDLEDRIESIEKCNYKSLEDD